MMLRQVLLLAAALGLAMSPAWAQTKPPQPPATAPAAASPATRPTLSLPAASAATTPAATAAPSWNGSWKGAFGARSDIVVTISADKVTGVALLGQPLTITSSSLTATTASVSGPDFSLTLTKVAPTSAQGAYENNRKEKASALFSKN
jgi:hypothetical protein